jgi:hypothetical protein
VATPKVDTLPSDPFEKLRNFITTKMQMSHIYQPVMGSRIWRICNGVASAAVGVVVREIRSACAHVEC